MAGKYEYARSDGGNISPSDSNIFSPGSVGSTDVTIGQISTFENVNIGEEYELPSGGAILITSREVFSLPGNVSGHVINRSRLARRGLDVGSPYLDPGHKGPIIIPVQNLNKFPLVLKVGQGIAQVFFTEIGKSLNYCQFKKDGELVEPGAFQILTLGNEFGVFDGSDQVRRVVTDKDGFTVGPGEFVLGITKESVELVSKGIIGVLSYPTEYFIRNGVFALGGILQPGYKGRITLELKNLTNSPQKLIPGIEIYRVYFWPAITNGSYIRKPGSKYVGDEITNHPQL